MAFFRRFLELSIVVLAVIVLFCAPLPSGSVTQGWRHLFEGISFLMLLLWVGLSLTSHSKPAIRLRNYFLPLIFVLICLLQILPMPGFLLGILSGKSLALWSENARLLGYLGDESRRSFYTISLYPNATWRETLLVLSYFSFGFVIANHFRTRTRVLVLLTAVFLVSLLEAGSGLLQFIVAARDQVGDAGMFSRGTYVNKNHFAGFLEMTVPLVLGYAVYLGNWMKGGGFSLKTLVATDNWGKQLIVLFLLGLMFLALLFSRSRTGILSVILAIGFFYLCTLAVKSAAAEGGVRSSGFAVLLFLFVALSFGLWIGLYPVYEHFLRASGDAPGRLLVWKDTLRQVRDFPIFGSGLGTFRYVYPLYKHTMEQPTVYRYAHNDYLQLLSETGVAGFAVLIGALSLTLRSLIKRLLSADPEGGSLRVSIAIGAMTGVISILLHSFADFNLHIPANGLYFSFLIGISYAMLFGKWEKVN